jgi:hypothetical protein
VGKEVLRKAGKDQWIAGKRCFPIALWEELTLDIMRRFMGGFKKM